MDQFSALLSTTSLLVLLGLVALLVLVFVNALRVNRGHAQAGLLNVLFALAASALITIGVVRIAFAATSDDNRSSHASTAAVVPAGASSETLAAGTLPAPVKTGNSQRTGHASDQPVSVAISGNGSQISNPPAQRGSGGSKTATDDQATPTLSATRAGRRQQATQTAAALAGGSTNDAGAGGQASDQSGSQSGNQNQNGSQTGNQTGGASSGSPNSESGTRNQANGGQSGGGGGQGGGNQNAQPQSGAGASGPFAQTANAAQSNQILITILLIGAAIIMLGGIALYIVERRRSDFDPTKSPGLLYAGVGIFIIVVAMVIPALPGQFFPASARGAGQGAGGSGRGAATTSGPLPTRVALLASTPTGTPAPSMTPITLPSLTPMPDDTPTPLYTAVAYANTDGPTTVTACSVTAQTMLFLRGDPSSKNQAIGKTFAGELLSVIGQTADKKWWNVVDTSSGTAVQGWVSADFVTAAPSCSGVNVPAAGPALTPTRTPRPLAAPVNAANEQSTATVSSCALITTTAVSLRPGPSKAQTPIAQIPQGTALTATARSADGIWWHVSYGQGDTAKDGWIGGAGALPAANCTSLVAETQVAAQ